jgi:hypothetical protein
VHSGTALLFPETLARIFVSFFFQLQLSASGLHPILAPPEHLEVLEAVTHDDLMTAFHAHLKQFLSPESVSTLVVCNAENVARTAEECAPFMAPRVVFRRERAP